MRLFITTGHVLSNVGGPAQYGPKLKEEFENAGHKVRLISYDAVERILPIGLRHIYFFLKILPSIVWADKVITLDTFSVGVPSVFAAKLSGREIAVRIGGDFLWESYVERTGNKITLKQFNEHIPQLNIKERYGGKHTIYRMLSLLLLEIIFQKNKSTLQPVPIFSGLGAESS